MLRALVYIHFSWASDKADSLAGATGVLLDGSNSGTVGILQKIFVHSDINFKSSTRWTWERGMTYKSKQCKQKENCRPDGRELGEFRATTVNIGSITTADGSALVKLGNTTVICGVKAELAAPAVDSANKGYIVPNVELPSLCSTRFRSGPPGEEAQVASQFIADVIENSQIIAKEDLCIANGKLAWVLYCDIICLDYDGNILDASAFALLAALKNVQLPSVTINEETGLSEVNLKQKNPLIIRKHPVATSFAIFDDTLLIVDPTAEEEDLATGTVTIVTDDEGRLCSVHKPGGSPLTGAKLQDCITRAITRHKEVKKLIDKVIKSIKPK